MAVRRRSTCLSATGGGRLLGARGSQTLVGGLRYESQDSSPPHSRRAPSESAPVLYAASGPSPLLWRVALMPPALRNKESLPKVILMVAVGAASVVKYSFPVGSTWFIVCDAIMGVGAMFGIASNGLYSHKS